MSRVFIITLMNGRVWSAFAVLPDFERWADNYVQISFDNDPTADNARLARLEPAQRRQLAGAPQAALPLIHASCVRFSVLEHAWRLLHCACGLPGWRPIAPHPTSQTLSSPTSSTVSLSKCLSPKICIWSTCQLPAYICSALPWLTFAQIVP